VDFRAELHAWSPCGPAPNVEAARLRSFRRVTYVSSSGLIAKVLAELRRLNNPETPPCCDLGAGDLAMAVYLPIVAVLSPGGPSKNGPVGLIGTGHSPSGSRPGCPLRRCR